MLPEAVTPERVGLTLPGRVDLGKTTVRVFTKDELDLLKRVKDLTESGITLHSALEGANGTGTGDVENLS